MTFRRGITNARFSMRADILKPGETVEDPVDPTDYGEWKKSQDPLTGQIIRIWVPFSETDTTKPDPDKDSHTRYGTIRCIARGIVDGGIRVAGTTERFGDTYENIDFVKMWVPAKTLITKRDRITNIRNKDGQVIWRDEEFEGVLKSTLFNVNGVTPLFDAFNKHTENFVLLERAEV